MSSSPLISIIIPAYNVADYIERTVNSILEQTYINFEIIIVEDGSQDETPQVVNEIVAKHPEKVKSFSIPNGGVTKARMYGVTQAEGEWIGFVDADDTVEPDMYQILVENALKYSADISHCGYKMVFEDGRANYFHNTKNIYEHDTTTAQKELLSGRIVEPGLCNKIYKKEVFERFIQNNQMDYTIKINEDLLMNFILFCCSKKSVFYDVCKYNYIVRSGSASRSDLNDSKVYDPIKVKEYIIKLASSDVKDAAIKAYVGTCINTYNLIMLSDNKKYSSELRKIRNRIKEKKGYIKSLNKKTGLLALTILIMPWAYKPLYSMYSRYFQEKKYE